MNNTQKAIFNCVNEVMKAWFDKVGYGDSLEIKASYSSIVMFTKKTTISWEFMELVQPITDRNNVSWEIGISTNNQLYFKFWK